MVNEGVHTGMHFAGSAITIIPISVDGRMDSSGITVLIRKEQVLLIVFEIGDIWINILKVTTIFRYSAKTTFPRSVKFSGSRISTSNASSKLIPSVFSHFQIRTTQGLLFKLNVNFVYVLVQDCCLYKVQKVLHHIFRKWFVLCAERRNAMICGPWSVLP